MVSNLKNKIPLAVAIILGLLSIIAINKYITAKTSIPEGKKARVIVSATDLKRDLEINQGDLTTKIISVNAVSDISITVPLGNSAAERSEIERMKMLLVGRKPNRNIPKGDPVLWSDLIDDEAESLSKVIKKDRRAVAISVNQQSSCGFNIVPGDHVDVVCTMEPNALNLIKSNLTRVRKVKQGDVSMVSPTEEGNASSVTYLLFQDIEVLAVGQNYNTTTAGTAFFNQKLENYTTVTLELTLQEAVMLTHVRTNATLSLILRSRKSLDRMRNPGFVKITDEAVTENINILDGQRVKEAEKLTLTEEQEKEKKVEEKAKEDNKVKNKNSGDRTENKTKQ